MRDNKKSTRSHWDEVHGFGKVQYLFDYYKFPLVLLGIALYCVIYIILRNANAQDIGLYVGLVNFAPSDELVRVLGEDYMEDANYPEGKSLYLYRNLFLSADADSEYHAYSYATRMKILGALDAEKLDVVLMDRESFDAFSQNGYLADLSLLRDSSEGFAEASLMEELSGYLISNMEIIEDNSVDVMLRNEDQYHAVTKQGLFGLDLTEASPVIRRAKLSDTLYLGIIRNSPRREEALRYVSYLASHDS